MFSFGWSELALTAIIIIIVVGPKEIPNLLKQIGYFTKSIKKITREFKSSISEITDNEEVKNIKESLTEINEIKKDFDPINKINNQTNSNIKQSNIFEKEITSINNLENKKNK